MRKNKKLMPELRFPEFENEEEWVEKTFKELFEIGNGRDYKHLGNGDIPVYGSGGYMLSVNDYLYDGDSVCIGRKGTIDKPMFLTDRFWTVDTLFFTHSFKDCLPKYIYYVFQNINWLQHNEAGGVPSLSKTNIYKIKSLTPKLQEQQKIASCLSSLDEVIEAHSQKLELLKDHKKGLMQNLFPQEGEKVPKYRFKEFEKEGEWVEKILYDVANYENGKAHEKDIDEDGNYTVVNSRFISTDGEVAKYSNMAFCLAEKEDVLMVLSDVPNGRAIAKCFYVNEENKYTVNQRICKITPFDCDSLFLLYIMNRNSYFLSFDDGVKQTNLRKDDVQSFPFLIPDDIQEQQKIASILSSLDELLTAQTEKIEQLKEHKKGLMQGLFLKINDYKHG